MPHSRKDTAVMAAIVNCEYQVVTPTSPWDRPKWALRSTDPDAVMSVLCGTAVYANGQRFDFELYFNGDQGVADLDSYRSPAAEGPTADA